MENIKQLAHAAPDHFNKPGSIDWTGVEEVLRSVGAHQQDVVAATWSSLSHRPSPFYESNSQLIMVLPHAIIGTVGKSKMFGGRRKYDGIDLTKVGQYEFSEDEVNGKYGILCTEFTGDDGVLLGRLVWHWSRRTRLPNNADPYDVVAKERARVTDAIRSHLG